MKHSLDVIVLGGGIAGLACAVKAVERGKTVCVIEKENAVGGLSRSIQKNGFTFDLGGHRFLPRDKELDLFIRSFFQKGELDVIDRKSQIFLNNTFLMYPPEILDILKKLGLPTCMACMTMGLFARIKHHIPQDTEISLKSWLMNRFGSKLYSIYFGPYSEKLWGRDPSLISADWAQQRISVSTISHAIWHILSTSPTKTYAKNFLYPAGGIGQIPERMAQSIKAKKGSVLLNSTVEKIIASSDGFSVVFSENGISKSIQAQHLVSSIPLPYFISRSENTVSETVKHAAKQLTFRPLRFINIMVDHPQITDNTWLYIPEKDYVFFRIQELVNWHTGNCLPGKTALTLEIACEKDDALWDMPEDRLLDLCVRDLNKMGIDIRDKILGHFSTYADEAYPVYSLEYASHLHTIYEYIHSFDNLLLCGRQGLFRYMNMDDAIATGFLAADALDNESLKKTLIRPEHNKEYLEKNLYWRKNEL